MKNFRQLTQRLGPRIAWLGIMAVVAVSLQYQPSVALPLAQSRLTTNHSPFQDSLLARAANRTLPIGTTLVVNNVHSLLTTPKLEPIPTASEATNNDGLSIHTEVRTRDAYSPVQPIVHFVPDMAPGSRKVVRHGLPGIVAITERLTLWNNVIVDRQMLSHIVMQRPQPGLINAAPPRNVAEAMAATGIRKLVAVYAMVATAYTADSAQAVPTGRTASGLPARYGVVAVDPRVIPLGSHLFIPGYGTAIAADTGGAIHGNRIDLCMDSYRSALIWGRQPVKVYVLTE